MSGERPGGWVPGIGWVAPVEDLRPSDLLMTQWGFEEDADTYRRRATQTPFLVVTRWADGSTPVPLNPDTDGERPKSIVVMCSRTGEAWKAECTVRGWAMSVGELHMDGEFANAKRVGWIENDAARELARAFLAPAEWDDAATPAPVTPPTADKPPPSNDPLRLLAAAAEAITAGRTFQECSDRMREALATGPDEIDRLRRTAQAFTVTDTDTVADERGVIWGAVRPFLTRFSQSYSEDEATARAALDVLAVEIADAVAAAAAGVSDE